MCCALGCCEESAGASGGILLSPLVNPLLGGRWRAYRAIDARTVAEAAIYLATRPARGRFIHDNDAILRAARSLPRPVKE